MCPSKTLLTDLTFLCQQCHEYFSMDDCYGHQASPPISWPEHEDLWHTMPKCFQYSFGKKTTVIIDCFEVFIEKPSNFLARAQTYSNYKSHNTIKVLIGISPQGTVTFVSQA